MKYKLYILAIAVLLVILPTQAIETVIVGDVYSETTGEAIPNANIVFQGTKVGTSTNAEGAFALRVNLSKRMNLVVSAIGYHTQRYQVDPGTMAGIQVALQEKTTHLDEVYVRPGVNPALALMDEVRARRKVNDRFLTQTITPATATAELYISDIQAKHLKRALWRSLEAGMLTTEDGTKLLPLYSSSQPVQLQADQLTPTGNKTEQTLVLSATDYSKLLVQNGNLDFYKNNISFLGQNLLSPLAPSGSTYYHYYLADSVQVDSAKHYIVHFKTKNPFYATFNGELEIDSATYALCAVTASLPKESSINYFKHLVIRQQLAPDHSLVREDISVLMDFSIKTDSSHLFPSLLMRSSLHAHLSPLNSLLSTLNSKLLSPDSLTPTLNSQLSTLNSLPLIRFATWTATIINTGYIPTGGWLEVGNIEEILQVNQHETVHLGLPLRTNEKLMKHVSLEAGIGYGFRDRALKGYGRVLWQLPTQRRSIFSAEYQDRYVWTEVDDFTRLMHENGIGYGTMDFTSYAFQALNANDSAVNTATRKRQFQVAWENDWSEHVETNLYARVGWMGYGDPLVGYHEIPSFPYQSLGGIVRIGFKERKIDGFFSRYHVYSHLPIIYVGVEGTSYKTADMSTYDLFAKFQLMVRQQVGLGQGGTLEYALQLGAIVGNAPYPFMHHFEGNQGYAYDPFRFTLMNNFQYTATRWLALHTEWNGHGVLFNLIPGIRYLRLRELATFKLAYGNTGYHPYVELGCGIGNILRVMDLYSVWRLTNREDPSTPLWAIRFRIHIGL